MTKENYKEKVVVDPESCGGRPHIKGTRIEISVILDALAEGLTPDEIVDHYPALDKSDVRAAAAYASELSRENTWKLTAS